MHNPETFCDDYKSLHLRMQKNQTDNLHLKTSLTIKYKQTEDLFLGKVIMQKLCQIIMQTYYIRNLGMTKMRRGNTERGNSSSKLPVVGIKSQP